MPIRYEGGDVTQIRYLGADVTSVFYPLASDETEMTGDTGDAFGMAGPPNMAPAAPTLSFVAGSASVVSGTSITLRATTSDADHDATETFRYQWATDSGFTNIVRDEMVVGYTDDFSVSMSPIAAGGVQVEYFCRVTDPGGASNDSTGQTVTWQSVFSPTASYTAGSFAAAGGTIPTGSYTTNIASPSASIGSNLGTNQDTRLVNDGFTATGGGNPNTPTVSGCGSYSPLPSQRPSGQVFTQSRTCTETTTYQDRTGHTTYRVVEDTAQTTTNTRSVTVTVSGTIPTGFVNAGNPTSATMTVSQLGSTGTLENQNVPGVGSRNTGTYQGSPTTQARPSITDTNVQDTQSAVGTQDLTATMTWSVGSFVNSDRLTLDFTSDTRTGQSGDQYTFTDPGSTVHVDYQAAGPTTCTGSDLVGNFPAGTSPNLSRVCTTTITQRVWSTSISFSETSAQLAGLSITGATGAAATNGNISGNAGDAWSLTVTVNASAGRTNPMVTGLSGGAGLTYSTSTSGATGTISGTIPSGGFSANSYFITVTGTSTFTPTCNNVDGAGTAASVSAGGIVTCTSGTTPGCGRVISSNTGNVIIPFAGTGQNFANGFFNHATPFTFCSAFLSVSQQYTAALGSGNSASATPATPCTAATVTVTVGPDDC